MKKTIIISAVAAVVATIVTALIVGCRKSKKYGQGRRWFDDYDPCDFIYEEDNEDD